MYTELIKEIISHSSTRTGVSTSRDYNTISRRTTSPRTVLGWNWLEALCLDWRTFFRVGKSQTLQDVLNKHSNVFKEELGELQGVQATIHVDKNVRPRFKKARTVPSERKWRELDHLQSLGAVRFSDWATPIVPVLKGDGRVRICGDYKVTINRAAKLEPSPI